MVFENVSSIIILKLKVLEKSFETDELHCEARTCPSALFVSNGLFDDKDPRLK